MVNGGFGCVVSLNTGSIRRQARSWGVPAPELVAMTVLHEQELCLQTGHSSMVPADAEQRFARKLRNGRLVDRFLVQVDASGRDRATVERALAIVRAHGELALQRRDEILRRHHNLVDPLRISACRPCRVDNFGTSTPTDQGAGSIECDVQLDLSAIEASARDWGLPVTELTASALVHLQEHCVRSPDDRETPALDEERHLARKLGSTRLVELIDAEARELDRSGHWKR